MSEKRHGVLERQAYVIIRGEHGELGVSGPSYHIAQQDGTRAVATNGGFTAQGPAVLKVSARLLKGPQEILISSPVPRPDGAPPTEKMRLVRSVSQAGAITWTELFTGETVADPNLERLEVVFFKDSMSAVGPQAAMWAMGFFDNVFRQSQPGG